MPVPFLPLNLSNQLMKNVMQYTKRYEINERPDQILCDE
jgi:hypothetical protein